MFLVALQPEPAHAEAGGPMLAWYTYYGGNGFDTPLESAVDGGGNVYITGYSSATWGNPIHALAGGDEDAFVVKFDNNEARLWNTFLGSGAADGGYGITVDGSRNVYVTGFSSATWGHPVDAFTKGPEDAFVAKLDSDGNCLWNTFLGGSSYDEGMGITVDVDGNIYVVGTSESTWGRPIQTFTGNKNAFVAKFTNDGKRLWNTFNGSLYYDQGIGIALDGDRNIYITGNSLASWGSPINDFAGGWEDAFVAKFKDDGKLLWNTFLGSKSDDMAQGIVVDGSRNIYVTGNSLATWGTPLKPYTGGWDTYVARLDSNGKRLWHTFLGSGVDEIPTGITVDGGGSIYVTGYGNGNWGAPLRPYGGSYDGYAVKFGSNGTLQWNTFLGGQGFETGSGIGVDAGWNVYVVGEGGANWGNSLPINPGAGNWDGFLAKLSPSTLPAIPIMFVQGNTNPIFSSDATPTSIDGTDFGEVAVDVKKVIHSFSIVNTGSAPLTLSGSPRVSLSGANAADFNVTKQPVSPVAVGGSETFAITFDPSSTGLRKAIISITNDSNTSPYTFALQGIGVIPSGESSGSEEGLPSTGFARGQITSLPAQPEDKVYSNLPLKLEIPRLGVNVEIVGIPRQDGWDVTWLGDKAGYLEGSAFPTWPGNTVLTGHVWNTQNRPGPFAGLKTLEYGDTVNIHAFGQIYIYEVRESLQVDPDDVAQVMKKEDRSWVTLVTCEGYNAQKGTYTGRRMVRAVLIKVE